MRVQQAKIIVELGRIYPIKCMCPGTYSIRGIALLSGDLLGMKYPRQDCSLHIKGRDDEALSTAYGHTAHIVLMLGKYMNVNLRYRIVHYSSRSYVVDDVQNSQTEYPLYRKGVDRERFERAVYYLNSNVKQVFH